MSHPFKLKLEGSLQNVYVSVADIHKAFGIKGVEPTTWFLKYAATHFRAAKNGVDYIIEGGNKAFNAGYWIRPHLALAVMALHTGGQATQATLDLLQALNSVVRPNSEQAQQAKPAQRHTLFEYMAGTPSRAAAVHIPPPAKLKQTYLQNPKSRKMRQAIAKLAKAHDLTFSDSYHMAYGLWAQAMRRNIREEWQAAKARKNDTTLSQFLVKEGLYDICLNLVKANSVSVAV